MFFSAKICQNILAVTSLTSLDNYCNCCYVNWNDNSNGNAHYPFLCYRHTSRKNIKAKNHRFDHKKVHESLDNYFKCQVILQHAGKRENQLYGIDVKFNFDISETNSSFRTSIHGARKYSFQVIWVLCHTRHGINMPVHCSDKRPRKYLTNQKKVA